jgi:hypothetical protein
MKVFIVKKLIYPLLSIALFAPMALIAAPAASKPSSVQEREKNTPPDLVDQTDTTDTLAIPLDESEEEEDVQEANLEKTQKKLQQNKAAPAKTAPKI